MGALGLRRDARMSDLTHPLALEQHPHALEQLSAAFKEIGVHVPPTTLVSWAMSGVPTDPRAKVPRKQLAEHLTAIGYPISRFTLDSLASRGGGPPYFLWRSIAIHEWGEALKWAQERLTAKRSTATEGRELDRAAKPAAKVSRTRRKTRALSSQRQIAAE
jgi:hypothetical protein